MNADLVAIDKPVQVVLTVSSILFGFHFTGFWWVLNREIQFKPEQRHFKLGTGLMFISMILLAVFGIVLPLRTIAMENPVLLLSYRGIVLALVVVFGYMLTEMAHHELFQAPNTTTSEKVCFICTVLVGLGFAVRWWLWR